MMDELVAGLIEIIEHLALAFGDEYHQTQGAEEEVEWALETYPERLAIYHRALAIVAANPS